MYYVLCNSDQWAVCWVEPTDQCGPVLPPSAPCPAPTCAMSPAQHRGVQLHFLYHAQPIMSAVRGHVITSRQESL